MADTLLIRALPSFRSLWLFPMCMVSFSPNWWSRSLASQDLVRPFTPRLLMTAPQASCLTCTMHCMWFLRGGHSIPEAASVDCSSSVIKWFREASTVVFPNKWPSERLKWSSMSFNCSASVAPVCWRLTHHPQLAFETGEQQLINLIESGSIFTQCPMLIHPVGNDRFYG